jgi:transcription elongation factor GreA
MTQDAMYITQEGLVKLKTELSFLINKKRKEIIEKIQIAKSYGDLSENAEYESAKSEQSFVEGRISEIEDILKKAKLIKRKVGNIVCLGSNIVVEVDGQESEYQLVGSSEANPGEKKISNESPIGQAILGKKAGDLVEIEVPDGKICYKIKKII